MSEVERINVLFVCSMNKWRSPTAEKIYSNNPNINVRSAGTSKKARRHVSVGDIEWADVVIVMEGEHLKRLRAEFFEVIQEKETHVLEIEDNYKFMDADLIEELREAIDPLLEG